MIGSLSETCVCFCAHPGCKANRETGKPRMKNEGNAHFQFSVPGSSVTGKARVRLVGRKECELRFLSSLARIENHAAI